MYAVVKSGAHQYRVKAGDTIDVDKLSGAPGESIKLDQVLMLEGNDLKLGAPFISGAHVEAKIAKQYFDDKILVYNFRRRKNSRKKNGHKQPKTLLEIVAVKES
jgi:large subunit ribosomal protein L21